MRHILALFLLLTSIAACAQDATIRRVELTNNIAASKYPMTDLNGRTAALVIVQVMADNVEFTGSVLNGRVVRKTGEYWVYMGVGAKELHIHSDKFLPVEIRFPDYGIQRLESAATYVVTLALADTSKPQSASVGRNYFVLTVSPADAKVTVDGKPAETRNGVAKVLLRSGSTYSYQVEAHGYLTEQGQVTIGASKVERNVALKSTKGTLSVATTTPGTEIYINGEKVGTGTWRGDLLPNEYLVEGRLASHRSTDRLATISTGQSTQLTLPALTPITGSLNVDYEPAGATITIDGKPCGTTPNIIENVLVGTRQISISAPGYESRNITAAVAESELTDVTGQLTQSHTPVPATHNVASSQGTSAMPVYENVEYEAFKDSSGNYGFKDKSGKVVIKPTYQWAQDFSEGLANVQIKGVGYGYIDKNGRLVIPAIYDFAQRFRGGFAGVRERGGKYGYINKANQMVIPPMYDDAWGFGDGLFSVKVGKNWGFIDSSNKMIISPKFDDAWNFENGKCLVKKDGKNIYIDITGREVH